MRPRMSDAYYLIMTNTKTTFHKPYFVTRFDSEVLEFAIFTPSPRNTDEGDLVIGFRSGRCYVYSEVSAGNYIGLIMADSAGKYFNANVRNLPSHESDILKDSAKNFADLIIPPTMVAV